jgi:hypothetical protein
MKPVFGKREEYMEQATHDAAVREAVRAIGELRFVAAVKACKFCHRMPHETTEDSFPCNHRGLYDLSLRHFGLAVLNDAAKIIKGQE